MTDEVANCTDVIFHFLGDRQRAAYQPRNPPAERVVEPLDVIGFAGVLTEERGRLIHTLRQRSIALSLFHAPKYQNE